MTQLRKGRISCRQEGPLGQSEISFAVQSGTREDAEHQLLNGVDRSQKGWECDLFRTTDAQST
ncbi:hypothetical protein RvY_14808 [Ramazzottius varieornatus]|uniref:Uncharacterized protein n=1 Tax=Ramazzottius varieornatus TaxID=947166 RepID=A0A1D1VSN9_RAMVA|nr:hypothetical protein RvY_14808 [Ramazzottius varieornatus]